MLHSAARDRARIARRIAVYTWYRASSVDIYTFYLTALLSSRSRGPSRSAIGRSVPRPRKNALPPTLTTPVPTFPATHVRGPAATHGALSGEGRVVGACNLPSSAVHYILARVRSPLLGGLMRTGGASWLMPFLVLSLYSIANDSFLFSAVPHA